MIRAFSCVAAAGFFFAACVPEGKDDDPRGAIGIDTTPSAAARGEPFVTSDGWTIRVEQLSLEVFVTAQVIDRAWTAAGAPEQAPGAHFDATTPTSVFVTGLEAGPAALKYIVGTVHLHARAQNGERVVALDLVIPPVPTPSSLEYVPAAARIDVSANALRTLHVVVMAEWLFRGVVRVDPDCEGSEATGEPTSKIEVLSPGLVFDDLASADTDGDGVVSQDELYVVRGVECGCCSPESTWPQESATSMADILARRAKELLAATR